MRPIFTLFIFSLLLSTVAGQEPDSAVPQGLPKVLTSILEEFTEKRSSQVEIPVQAEIDALHGNYLKALENALKKIIASGRLEPAQEIQAEQKRIEANQSIDPGIEPESAELMQLRETLLAQYRKIEAGQELIQSRLENELIEILQPLQVGLVRQARIEDAAAVKAFSEGDGLGKFIRGEGSVHLKSVPTMSSDSLLEPGEGADKQIFPLDTRSGSLGAYSSTKSGNYKDLDISRAEKFNDFVRVSIFNKGDWAGIRSNGRVVSSVPEYEKLRNVARIYDFGYYLDTSGNLDSVEDRRFRKISNVVQFSVGTVGGVAVTSDGKLHLLGEAPEPPEELGTVVTASVTWGVDFLLAILSDGQVITWGEKAKTFQLPETFIPPYEVVSGWHGFFVKTGDGSVWRIPNEALPESAGDAISVKGNGNVFAFQKSDFSWFCLGKGSENHHIENLINDIGPAIDIAYSQNSNSHSQLIWIEEGPTIP